MDRAVVEGDRLVVLDILEDIQVEAADRIEYLGLDLAVGEVRMPRVYLESRRPVVIHVAGDIEEARLDVVVEIDLAGHELLGDMVARGKGDALSVEPALVYACEPADHLIRERIGTRTCQNSELRGIGVAHAGYLQSTGLEKRLPFRVSDVNARADEDSLRSSLVRCLRRWHPAV